ASIFSPAVRTSVQKKQRRQSLQAQASLSNKANAAALPATSTATLSSSSPRPMAATGAAPSSVLKQPKYSGPVKEEEGLLLHAPPSLTDAIAGLNHDEASPPSSSFQGEGTDTSFLIAADTSFSVATNLAQTMEDVNMEDAFDKEVQAGIDKEREAAVDEKAQPDDDNAAAAQHPPPLLLQSVSSATPTTIEVETLLYRLSLLFPPEKYPQLQYKPCILPRLIACYTLHKDSLEQDISESESGGGIDSITMTKTPAKRTTRRRKRSLDSKTNAIQHLRPVRDFLNALVDLEWNLLDDPLNVQQDFVTPSTTTTTSNTHQHKNVHFAAFDGSSLCPPSDVEEDSHQQQQVCVGNLVKVMQLVDSMGGKSSGDEGDSDSDDIKHLIQDMVSYLDTDFRLYYHDKTCARSVLSRNAAAFAKNHQIYPTRRVEKAASSYSRDLESILEKWNLQQSEESDSDSSEPVFLTWQCRLADVAAQLVRFWLRTLMNPIPCRAEMKNKTQRWQDRFVDIVDLAEISSSAFLLPNGASTKSSNEEMSVAIEDGSLSSILSDALSHIYDYLGGIPLSGSPGITKSELWRQRLLEVLPTETCCASDRCRMGIGTGRKPAPPLSDQEWKVVGDELQVASDFFAFYHRVLFLEQLVEILLQAGDWASHWEDTVQSAAQHLVVLHQSVQESLSSSSSSALNADAMDGSSLLPLIQQEDAHLVLLGLPLTELLQRIQDDILPLAKERYKILRKNYQTTVAAFKLGKANTQHKKKYQPQVGELEEYWNDLFEGTVFPSIAMAKKDE
ncbi:MAG: hypothetical protein SGILL_006987, partial [Bacillariaceae sp.]